MKKVTLAVMAAALFCIGPLAGTVSAADKNACADDIAKFCQNIEPGIAALMDCLEKHEGELTPACKAQEVQMEKGKTERREQIRERMRFRQACMNDMATFCNDANLPPGGMIRCLNDHKNELSVSCSESIKAMVE